MAPPKTSVVERLLSGILESEVRKLTEKALPSLDKPGKAYCPEGSVLAYLTINGRIKISALGFSVSPDGLNSLNYIGDGTFRLAFDIKADRACADILSKTSVIIHSGPLKLSYPVASLGAKATLKIKVARLVISAHIRLRECDKRED